MARVSVIGFSARIRVSVPLRLGRDPMSPHRRAVYCATRVPLMAHISGIGPQKCKHVQPHWCTPAREFSRLRLAHGQIVKLVHNDKREQPRG